MATREMYVTYGAVTIGGISTDYLLDGFTRHSVRDGKADSWIEFDCVVHSATGAGFAALCAALETTFRTPRKDLVVVQNGVTLLRAAHSDADGGMNTEPEIRKIGDVGDSGRSRRYTIRVAWEAPADTASTSGLRESTVNVEYDASRIRTIRIAGTFTAVPSTTSARSRYEAAIAAHVSSVLSGLSVTTSELIGEPVTEQDYDDKVLRFERVYLELYFGQGQDSATNHASIVDQTLTVTRREVSEDRSPATPSGGGAVAGGSSSIASPGTVQALAIFDLHYECSVDATASTDLKGLYDSIRAWLVGQFNAAFSQGTFALTMERVDLQRAANRLVVDMTAEGAVRGADMVSRTATVQTRTQPGITLRGRWTGSPLDFNVYQGFDTVIRTTTLTARHLTTKDPEQVKQANEDAASGGAESGGLLTGGGGGGWITIDATSTFTAIRKGIEGSGHVLNLVDVTSVVSKRKINRAGGGGRGGAGIVQQDGPGGEGAPPNTIFGSGFGGSPDGTVRGA